MKSSNVEIVQVGDLVEGSQRYARLCQVEFGKVTEVEFFGESGGLLPLPERRNGRQRYTIMFGQGVTATVLQVISGIATMTNGGVEVSSHLTNSWRAPGGKVIRKKVDAGARVYIKETIRGMLTMMQGAVSGSGEASTAIIEGYPVAGKNGTTQLTNSGGQQIGTIGSFSGVFPIDNPRAVVTAVIEHPATSVYDVVVTIPAFKDIANVTIRELDIPPTNAESELYPIGR